MSCTSRSTWGTKTPESNKSVRGPRRGRVGARGPACGGRWQRLGGLPILLSASSMHDEPCHRYGARGHAADAAVSLACTLASWLRRDAMPFLDLPEVKLFYLQRGSGPDIVWIPGGDNVAA